MAWSDDDFVTAFDAEAGDVAALATDDQKILWFNEGQSRLLIRKPSYYDLTWAQGDRAVPLPADYVKMDKLVEDEAVESQPWREWGGDLVLDDPEGASAAGTARLYYWAEWAAMTTGTVNTELNSTQDYACLYYALSRFFKKLSSNRSDYKRYSTLVGQNAVTMGDLGAEADRHYSDFVDSMDTLPVDPPTTFYGG